MFFDDRLATVLRQRAQSDAMRRTQYRQLLDLLGAQATGARGPGRDPSLVAAAWMRMNKLAETLPSKDRARLIAEPGWRLRNPELVAHLANFEPEVASAALTRAQLPSEDWNALIPRLPVRARGFMRLRRDLPQDTEATLERLGIHDRGLPTPQPKPAEVGAETGPVAFDEEPLELGPLELGADDELPGANIPPEDIPNEPFVSAPLDPLPDEEGDPVEEASAPLRPIFFPKDRNKGGTAKPEETVEDKEFEPKPFTIEELREIAEEPLNINEPVTEDQVAEEKSLGEDFSQYEASTPNSPLRKGGRGEISALVERIANFQRAREETPAPGDADETASDADLSPTDRLMPRLPLGEEETVRSRIVRGFAFAADAAGRIEWAEDHAASMVVGTRLVAPARLQTSVTQNPLAMAFNQRQPMKSAPFHIEGAQAITGDWIVDAQPRFSQIGGFAGYVGRMRRPIEAAPTGPSPAQREADRIRQLLHELRTPVTAVQGYSEVIQQQLFGSAPHEYRALAAAIASDAARILSGFEELDRLAKFETGAMEVDEGQTDIAALANRIIRQLAQVLDARMAGIALDWHDDTPLFAAIGADNAESLMWRLLASVGGACAASETLEARLEDNGDFIRLTCELPMQLLGEEDLFAADVRPSGTAISPGLFGAGFALRLARAETRAGGGDLVRKSDSVILTLPRVSTARANAPGNTGPDFAAH
ncbi:hypothetical protein EH31_06850 [Erythrobacter longus]|uniref:histidine kinase n=1 Tax=Erythrobacter longus TaxID=1044 RepID=A0A074MYN7_ERYLO|nr:histidine kinase dimerization/phospho-acceptor domain-containing protein [Erythrobacter longus]KEO90752.1 hypothetical protein EH31_06850 [Erythrobacter longus]